MQTDIDLAMKVLSTLRPFIGIPDRTAMPAVCVVHPKDWEPPQVTEENLADPDYLSSLMKR